MLESLTLNHQKEPERKESRKEVSLRKHALLPSASYRYQDCWSLGWPGCCRRQ